jgi:RNA polymerase sigma factor (TIGR02999 family)
LSGPEASVATLLLQRLSRGESAVEGELYALLYEDLHRRAVGFMRRQPRAHSLQPTDLVHEAWLRVAHGDTVDWQGRAHFLRVAVRAMRSVLVDHARAAAADKRGGDRLRLALLPELSVTGEPTIEVLALDEALHALRTADEQLHRVAELRIFGGLEHDEIGRVLGLSTRTVERAWRLAREVLAARLADG